MRQELYKLDSKGCLVKYSEQSIVLHGKVYTNPSIDILWSAGFRPMGTTEIPDFDPETHTFKVDHYVYNEDQSEIIPVCIIEALSVETEMESKPTIEERIAALEQDGVSRDLALAELATYLYEVTNNG